MNAPPSRYLVVENDPDNVAILSHLLQRAGVTGVSVCLNGERAIQILETLASEGAREPITVLLDVGLPGIAGFEVLKWIRRHPRLSASVVILFSASDEPRNLGKAIQLGADCYLVKYPTISIMRNVLNEAQKSAALPLARPPLDLPSNLLLNAFVAHGR